jgi:Tol biopolymer transport system component
MRTRLPSLVAAAAALAACSDHTPTTPDATTAVPVQVEASNAAAVALTPDAILYSRSAYDKKSKTYVRQIFAARSNGTGEVQLTSGPGNKRWPAWSGDRSKIAFASDATGNFDLWIMNANGSGQKQLTTSATHHERHPAFTPDGQRIAFERVLRPGLGDTLKAEGWVVDAAGGNEQARPHWASTCVASATVTCAPAAGDPGARAPTTFVANGGLTYVAVAARDAKLGTHGILLRLADQVQPETWLAHGFANRTSDPHFDPNFDWLAYSVAGLVLTFDMTFQAPEGMISYQDPVTKDFVPLSDPSWSPNGKLLVAVTGAGGLVKFDPKNPVFTRILANTDAIDPAWSR